MTKIVRLQVSFCLIMKHEQAAVGTTIKRSPLDLPRLKVVRLASNPILVGRGPLRPLPASGNIGHGQKRTNINGEASKSVSKRDVIMRNRKSCSRSKATNLQRGSCIRLVSNPISEGMGSLREFSSGTVPILCTRRR
jgi:hypothetical protein